ncbi:MAG: hypothetical protein AAGI46_09950 [Planctomycetota bacterium]
MSRVHLDRDAWTFAFVPEGDGAPAACRARKLLKSALRVHGMRCIAFDLPPRHLLRCHANATAGLDSRTYATPDSAAERAPYERKPSRPCHDSPNPAKSLSVAHRPSNGKAA